MSDEPRLCAKCKTEPRKGPSNVYCKRCHSAYMREWRADKKAGKRRKERKPVTWAALLSKWDKRLA